MKQKVLVEGKDYYINEQGLLVMTASFLKKRGKCCHNGCKHCPYKDCFCQKERKRQPKSDSPLDEK